MNLYFVVINVITKLAFLFLVSKNFIDITRKNLDRRLNDFMRFAKFATLMRTFSYNGTSGTCYGSHFRPFRA